VALLEISGLVQAFGGLVAVDQLDLSVEDGRIFGLIGPNGSGKSTVFNCISRFYQPQSGGIRFNGKNLLKMKPHQVVRIGIARTFQNLELFENLTVLENLLVAHHTHFRSKLPGCALNLPRSRREERAAREAALEILRLLDLAQYAEEKVPSLPLGMRRRVEMARALVTRPRLILLDEPASGLNHREIDHLTETLRDVNDRFKVTILLVEHNMNIVMSLCERIAVMNFGKKIAEGTPEEVRSHPEVVTAYLGEKK